MKEAERMCQECDFCPMCGRCGGFRSEEDCAEMLAGMIDDAREEFNSAWREYISEYED